MKLEYFIIALREKTQAWLANWTRRIHLPTSRKSQLAVIMALVVLLGGTAAGLLWALATPNKPDIAKTSPEDIGKYIASKKFENLSGDQRRDFMRQVHETHGDAMREQMRNLTDEQRDQMRENMRGRREEEMDKQMDAYFALPEAEREAYLDNLIDQRGERLGNRPGGDGRQPNIGSANRPARGPGHGRPALTPDRIKRRIETTDPTRRAQREAFRQAMREHMQKKRDQKG